MYARRRRLGQYETTAEAQAAALQPAPAPSTAEFWGKAVGAVVGAAAQILERKPSAPYFAPPPRVAVALPTAAAGGMPGWLWPVGLVAAGGAALWLFTRR